MTSHRQQRISELLREELSLLISAELDDPRLAEAMVSVADVRVTPDLQSARVYVDHSAPPADSPAILEALRHAEPFLRRALIEHLDLRVVPTLHFYIDETSRRARRIDEILNEIAQTSADDLPQPRSSEADEHDDAG